MQTALNPEDLAHQNYAYAGTGGTSQVNHGLGFSPAYMDTENGEMVISRFADGRPAPVHLLGGLPEEWIIEDYEDNGSIRLKETIIAGFIRNDRFYTRAEAAKVCSH